MKFNVYLVSTDHHLKVASANIIENKLQPAIIFSINYERHIKQNNRPDNLQRYSHLSISLIFWLFITRRLAKVYLPDHVKHFYIFTFFPYHLIEDGMKNKFPIKHNGLLKKLYFSRTNGNNENCKGFLGTQELFVPLHLERKSIMVSVSKSNPPKNKGVLIILQPLSEDGHLSQEAAIKCYQELQRQVLRKLNHKKLGFFLRPHPRSEPAFVKLLTKRLQGEVSIDETNLYSHAATLFSSFIFEYSAEWIYISGTSINKQLSEIFGEIPMVENHDRYIF